MRDAAVAAVRRRSGQRPEFGIVLGTGLGGIASMVQQAIAIPYSEIPGWPASITGDHAGRLVAGMLANRPVAVMAGRVHLYEGLSAAEAAFGVGVMAGLGVGTLIVTNAAGAINQQFHPGQLALITDHINLQGSSPLAGSDASTAEPRFPDMSEAYSARLRARARAVAAREGIDLAEGVYAAMLGPQFETPAEIHFLRTIGADLVGMSTVPEVIAARQMGVEVLGVSLVTNMAAGLTGQPLSHAEVLEQGKMSQEALGRLIAGVVGGGGKQS